jgi:hypothetical protein
MFHIEKNIPILKGIQGIPPDKPRAYWWLRERRPKS